MVLQRGLPPPGASERSVMAVVTNGVERERRGSCHSDASDASFVSVDTSAVLDEVSRVIEQVDERMSKIEAGHDVHRPDASAEDVAAAAAATISEQHDSPGGLEPAGGWLSAQQIMDGAAMLPW